MTRWIALIAALTTCGSDSCSNKDEPNRPICRSQTEARVEASRIMRSPVVCDGDAFCDDLAHGGYVCVDNHGSMVTCPPVLAKPCALNSGEPENAIQQPLDAGIKD